MSALAPEPLRSALEHYPVTNPPGQSQIHGDEHWRCVALAALHIARQVDVRERPVSLPFLWNFALLHDCMREDDGGDPDHGSRAAALFDQLTQSPGIPGLERDRKDSVYLHLAIQDHPLGYTTDHLETGICWDADRILLGRVGITVDPDYLSTDAGRASISFGRALGAHSKLRTKLPTWAEISDLYKTAELRDERVGFRIWVVTDLGLTALDHETAWKPGINTAVCLGAGRDKRGRFELKRHHAPDPDCTCGLYVLHEPLLPAAREVAGAVVAWGPKLEDQPRCFRARHSRVAALAECPGDSLAVRRMIRALAQLYRCPVVPYDHLHAIMATDRPPPILQSGQHHDPRAAWPSGQRTSHFRNGVHASPRWGQRDADMTHHPAEIFGMGV